ncbi:Histone H2A.Z-specific chaperone [Monascus purpureus]|uniref:Histone H2A.Z-specific chaperone n=1 Tax=Monascus purpureus TaxID=5098 RepID=A0A507QI59_MONPU|nr:Histone H2A.Z-specific chaperone [Monascus purpureus]BDD58086.1 Histone H2A.Z-specific chaperone [Monascus purpureus]
MGDNDKTVLQDDPAANAPDAAAAEKGKGKAKAVEEPAPQDLSEDESDEGSGPEDIIPEEDDDDEDHDNLEPISADNIIQGGRRTRGKQIDFAEAAEKSREAGDDEMEDDEDDEDFAADEDGEMRD